MILDLGADVIVRRWQSPNGPRFVHQDFGWMLVAPTDAMGTSHGELPKHAAYGLLFCLSGKAVDRSGVASLTKLTEWAERPLISEAGPVRVWRWVFSRMLIRTVLLGFRQAGASDVLVVTLVKLPKQRGRALRILGKDPETRPLTGLLMCMSDRVEPDDDSAPIDWEAA